MLATTLTNELALPAEPFVVVTSTTRRSLSPDLPDPRNWSKPEQYSSAIRESSTHKDPGEPDHWRTEQHRIFRIRDCTRRCAPGFASATLEPSWTSGRGCVS